MATAMPRGGATSPRPGGFARRVSRQDFLATFYGGGIVSYVSFVYCLIDAHCDDMLRMEYMYLRLNLSCTDRGDISFSKFSAVVLIINLLFGKKYDLSRETIVFIRLKTSSGAVSRRDSQSPEADAATAESETVVELDVEVGELHKIRSDREFGHRH